MIRFIISLGISCQILHANSNWANGWDSAYDNFSSYVEARKKFGPFAEVVEYSNGHFKTLVTPDCYGIKKDKRYVSHVMYYKDGLNNFSKYKKARDCELFC